MNEWINPSHRGHRTRIWQVSRTGVHASYSTAQTFDTQRAWSGQCRTHTGKLDRNWWVGSHSFYCALSVKIDKYIAATCLKNLIVACKNAIVDAVKKPSRNFNFISFTKNKGVFSYLRTRNLLITNATYISRRNKILYLIILMLTNNCFYVLYMNLRCNVLYIDLAQCHSRFKICNMLAIFW